MTSVPEYGEDRAKCALLGAVRTYVMLTRHAHVAELALRIMPVM
eukprot:CAMPEP_0206139368 /NCGR_PEP_ID=MMETSP1473-20131121/5676_1 /ASSEMBLY_ACC=CAM_ASM_001109 /TAXON_ID=1461547 /ORGANISM="Stichococcus sp, Strain RCC1054" /LENGTH=43 /DNA_ID= /DNA_START= /DNA_END= /DNA_ORIENTATION=